MTVQPGRQLAGRYRVEDLLSDRAGARSWRAVDEVLRRSVAIDVLPSDALRASALVQAARRSAVVTDGRFLRVLDASEENGDVYVVREWARGESLDLVLADGPLTPRRAAWIIREVAEAVSTAHRAGIYHLRLTPENVLVTDTGGVKIVGLATDAALHGVNHADAEAEDVRGLGRLLYATLVARWPAGPESGLPAAPVEHGRLLLPRQVRAGVPRPVDEVCDRILGEPPRHQAEPLRHASAVAAELASTVRLAGFAQPHNDPDQTRAAGRTAVGASGHPASTAPMGGHSTTRTQSLGTRTHPAAGTWAGGYESTRQIPEVGAESTASSTTARTPAPAPPPPAAPPPAAPKARRGTPRRTPGWLWAGLAVVVAGLAVVAFYLGLNAAGDDPADQSAPGPSPTDGPQKSLQPVGIASVSAWDPFGEDGENDEEAPLVLDGNPQTQWRTLSYEGNPEFGSLKPGLGLILDLGKTSEVSRVNLDIGGSGTDLEIRAAPAVSNRPPSQLSGYHTVGATTGASGETVVRLDKDVSTRYLLVWLTKLAPEAGGTYSGRISEITVEG